MQLQIGRSHITAETDGFYWIIGNRRFQSVVDLTSFLIERGIIARKQAQSGKAMRDKSERIARSRFFKNRMAVTIADGRFIIHRNGDLYNPTMDVATVEGTLVWECADVASALCRAVESSLQAEDRTIHYSDLDRELNRLSRELWTFDGEAVALAA